MQDSPVNFFEKIIGNVTDGINSCTLGRIETFDAEKMKANVTPLVSGKPMLIEVPVSLVKAGAFVIRPPYKPGDIVLVVFADDDMDNALLSGGAASPNSSRKHSLDDAIVVGGIMPFAGNLPSEHADDLIIGKDDFTAKIVISEEGEITIKSEKTITIESEEKVTITVPSGSTDWK